MTGLQTFIGNYILKSKLRENRNVLRLLPINRVKSICVLVDLQGLVSHKELMEAEQTLKQYIPHVDIISYYNGKELPRDFTGMKYFFLDNRDITLIQIPKEKQISDFLEKKYDVVMLFNPGQKFPLNYLSAVLNSKLKIGMNSSFNNHGVDFQLLIKDERLNHFIDVTLNYLKQINQNQDL
ncbi:MAG: hypothetical protein K9I68_04280 [Bacteroidales bacterium]|nr:hypothetical protein [Bacteroidales bacterium]MCF8337773.1 hypothetical protein [Bacteroidales bacterium]